MRETDELIAQGGNGSTPREASHDDDRRLVKVALLGNIVLFLLLVVSMVTGNQTPATMTANVRGVPSSSEGGRAPMMGYTYGYDPNAARYWNLWTADHLWGGRLVETGSRTNEFEVQNSGLRAVGYAKAEDEKNGEIFDLNKNPVGYVEDSEVFDMDGNKKGYILDKSPYADEVYDENGTLLGTAAKPVTGGAMILLILK